MHIAIDIRNIGRNRTGSELVVLNITKNVLRIDTDADAKNTYTLLTDADEQDVLDYVKDALKLADKKNVSVVTLPAKNKFNWAAWHVWRWMREMRKNLTPVDVYYTEYILPFFIPAEVKLITHVHDVSFADPATRDLIKKTDLFFLDFLIPWSIKRADHVIAASQFTKEEIIKYYDTPSDKVTVIYNAVETDLQEARKTWLSPEKLQEKYNLPQKYILSMGSMQPRKNIPRLIAAFAHIAEKIPNTHLVIAGKKAHNFDDIITETIAKDSAIASRIMFTGYIDENDKLAVFAHAQLFAFPSLYEGFGVPILEALSVHTPVVAGDIPPHHEVGGDAIAYAHPEQIDQLAQNLYDICTDKEIRDHFIGKSDTQIKKFSWEKSAQQFLNLYL